MDSKADTKADKEIDTQISTQNTTETSIHSEQSLEIDKNTVILLYGKTRLNTPRKLLEESEYWKDRLAKDELSGKLLCYNMTTTRPDITTTSPNMTITRLEMFVQILKCSVPFLYTNLHDYCEYLFTLDTWKFAMTPSRIQQEQIFLDSLIESGVLLRDIPNHPEIIKHRGHVPPVACAVFLTGIMKLCACEISDVDTVMKSWFLPYSNKEIIRKITELLNLSIKSIDEVHDEKYRVEILEKQRNEESEKKEQIRRLSLFPEKRKIVETYPDGGRIMKILETFVTRFVLVLVGSLGDWNTFMTNIMSFHTFLFLPESIQKLYYDILKIGLDQERYEIETDITLFEYVPKKIIIRNLVFWIEKSIGSKHYWTVLYKNRRIVFDIRKNKEETEHPLIVEEFDFHPSCTFFNH